MMFHYPPGNIRKLTYPTMLKGTSSTQKCLFGSGYGLVPWRVPLIIHVRANSYVQPINRKKMHISQPKHLDIPSHKTKKTPQTVEPWTFKLLNKRTVQLLQPFFLRKKWANCIFFCIFLWKTMEFSHHVGEDHTTFQKKTAIINIIKSQFKFDNHLPN